MLKPIRAAMVVPGLMALAFLLSAYMLVRQGNQDIVDEVASAELLAVELAHAFQARDLTPDQLRALRLRHIRLSPADEVLYPQCATVLDKWLELTCQTRIVQTVKDSLGNPWSVSVTGEDEIRELEESLFLAFLVFTCAGGVAWLILVGFTGSLKRTVLQFERCISASERDGGEVRFSESHGIRELGELHRAFNQSISAIEASRSDNQELSTHLIHTQERERKFLGQELHDNLGQIITACRALLYSVSVQPMVQQTPELLSPLSDLSITLKQSHEVLRALVHNLDMLDFETQSFAAAYLALLNDWQKSSGVQLVQQVDIDPAWAASVTADLQVGLYRITQEALSNVTRHAKASAVQVVLTLSPGSGYLSIFDNGVGLSRAGAGYGMRSMRERARHLGAQFAIESSMGAGCAVKVWFNEKKA
ncbi:MAG: sensor histidine kinase [Limnobacter sp.]|uniref:sensor histidine kinase n=1 Tax=Limnobacter sp. TaxID=2003368 RepID=UPI00391A1EAD